MSNLEKQLGDQLAKGLGLREQKQTPVPPLELARTAFPWPWAPYQIEILETLLAGRWTKLLVLAPPRHRKTSVIALYTAILVGKNPNTRVLVMSHTRAYASLLIDQIQAIMEMPIYRRAYGNLLPASKGDARWQTYERHLPNRPAAIKDPTFLALSPDSGTPGYGAELILCDDLVTEENSATPATRRSILHRFSVLLKRLEPAGRVLVVGARFFREDLYGVLLRRGDWLSLIYRASAREPLWPDRWSAELLAEKEREDPIFFPAQFLQAPSRISAGVLNPEWLGYYLEVPPGVVYAGTDTAIKSVGSKFAYAVVSRDPEGLIYLLDAYSGRHDIREQANLIDALQERWEPAAVAWESNGPQEAVMELIRPTLKNYVNLIGIPSLVSKELRLSSIAGHARQGHILIPGRISSDGEIGPIGVGIPLADAWGSFPGGDSDLLDAFEKAVTLALRGPPPAVGVRIPSQQAEYPVRQRSNPFTAPKMFPRVFHDSFELSPND